MTILLLLEVIVLMADGRIANEADVNTLDGKYTGLRFSTELGVALVGYPHTKSSGLVDCTVLLLQYNTFTTV